MNPSPARQANSGTHPDYTPAPAHEKAAAASLFDTAVAAFRNALPEHGLKLVVPPPLADGREGQIAVSAWRRGAESARVHAARSAGEAMLLLLARAAELDRQDALRKRCGRCRGVGWFIGPGGAKVICTHPDAQR